MESCKLYQLPVEILHHVAACLHETHRGSLYSFGLASRICHEASLPSIFQELHLSVHSRETLKHNVDALVKVLNRNCSSSHVRHLGLKGFLRLKIDRESDELENTTGAEQFWMTGIPEVLGDEEPYLGGHYVPDKIIEVPPEEDGAWAPVARLIKTLPRLTKLIYDCRNQFPPSLLTALHKYQPRCKLYHLTFRLRSLGSDTPDPHEMALATSPCLYSIKTIHSWRDSNGEDDYHEDAMPELVTGLAPNLVELRMVQLFPNGSYYHRSDISRKPWRGLPGFISGAQTGRLTSLSLIGLSNFTPEFLRTWSQAVDFSFLKNLALGGGSYNHPNGMGSESMEWIVQNLFLPKLETLRIRLDRGERHVVQPNYANDAVNFFTTLKPLYELTVDGPLEPEILDAILYRHGHTLRKLSLSPFETSHAPGEQDVPHIPMVFEKMHVLQIQARCPGLQELAVTVKRTESDAREADIYRSFAQFEHLQSLFLTLSFWDRQIFKAVISRDDPRWDDHDHEFVDSSEGRTARPLREGHLRETFINCAVDETLARSIWNTICQHKVGKQLKSLKLYPSGGDDFYGDIGGASNIDDFVKNLSRFWLIEKSIRDDIGTINVRELGREAREARDTARSEYYDAHYKGDRTGALLPPRSGVHVFRRIWPRKEGSMDWRQDWKSFPLHGF